MAKPDFSLVCCTNIWNHYQATICTELASLLGEGRFTLCLFESVHEERRKLGWVGDVRHSHADISHAATIMGYHPTHTLSDGLKESLP